MIQCITIKSNKEFITKYEKLKDGNYVYFDNVEDDPNITIEIEDIVRDKKELEFNFLITDFGKDVFKSPRVILYY